MRDNEETEQNCDSAVQHLPSPAWQGENERADELKESPDDENIAMKTVATSALTSGLVTSKPPVTPKRIAASKW